ncbi:hypothetical protein BB560_001005 [Smittium megazygosporum]|uniref:Uncharacterized protein n=1 Tax=Smittium megazygosporum TaxID=133381 RepID=A0A2T9ZIU7_9FUNG|nr:hypothetical protein BB560_001003 [Smittium megazygosporum]PVV04498.1 hypothetical protein BB560_001005 [Smittium megazygosporum]
MLSESMVTNPSKYTQHHYQAYGDPDVNYDDPLVISNISRIDDGNNILLNLKAGSTVFMSGYLVHCSLPNYSTKYRTAYMPQFSYKPVIKHSQNTDSEDTCVENLVAFAVPM